MDALERAKVRAMDLGVKVWVIEQGRRYCVPSGTDAGVGYEVVVHEGEDLSCNCKSGQHGRPCKHLGAVLVRLEAEQTVVPQSRPERSLTEKLLDLYPHLEVTK